MTDTIRLAKECGFSYAHGEIYHHGYKCTKELEAFRKRIEDEMKEKIIQEHDFFISEKWLADSIRSMK